MKKLTTVLRPPNILRTFHFFTCTNMSANFFDFSFIENAWAYPGKFTQMEDSKTPDAGIMPGSLQ